MSLSPRGRLAWRLYAVGLVQLVILVAVFLGVGFVLHPHVDEGETHPGLHSSGAMPPGAPSTQIGPGPASPPGPHHHPRTRHFFDPVNPMLTLLIGGAVIIGIASILTARWIARPLADLSRAAKALGAGDLTARVGLTRDDELGEVGRAFDEMAGRIQALLLAEKELMANVSHELRTPLARIRVALDIAGEGDAEAGRLSISEIGVDLSELEALIDDILTATRLEIAGNRIPAGSYALHIEEIGAEVLAERSAERFRARHPLRPFELALEPGLPIVHADPVLLRRVIDNLLENAHKYSPDPDRPITLSVKRSGADVTFAVKDEGMGISADDLPHVFIPFFRGEKSRARGTGGVGLGMTLAKRIVEAHEGAIEVASRVGEGTTVKFGIPARH